MDNKYLNFYKVYKDNITGNKPTPITMTAGAYPIELFHIELDIEDMKYFYTKYRDLLYIERDNNINEIKQSYEILKENKEPEIHLFT